MAKRKGVHPLVGAATLLPLAVSLFTPKTHPPAPTAATAAVHAKGACHPSLSSCPAFGCETEGTPHALVNETKRRIPTTTTAKSLTLDDFVTLQEDADSTVGEDVELDASDRARLQNITVSSGRVSEGDLVSVAGFLVGKPHPNTGESVNCNLSGSRNNDFHIPFAADPDQSPYQGIVVEMIPQDRPPEWNIKLLNRVEAARRMVLVTGQLFYDNMHRVNPDQDNNQQGQPPRFSLFEVHPITNIAICQEADKQCDPEQTSQWETLDKFAQENVRTTAALVSPTKKK
jgi:hypothetical protein